MEWHKNIEHELKKSQNNKKTLIANARCLPSYHSVSSSRAIHNPEFTLGSGGNDSQFLLHLPITSCPHCIYCFSNVFGEGCQKSLYSKWMLITLRILIRCSTVWHQVYILLSFNQQHQYLRAEKKARFWCGCSKTLLSIGLHLSVGACLTGSVITDLWDYHSCYRKDNFIGLNIGMCLCGPYKQWLYWVLLVCLSHSVWV